MNSFVVVYTDDQGKILPLCEFGIFKVLPNERLAKREMEKAKKLINENLNINEIKMKDWVVADLAQKLKTIGIKQIEYTFS